MVENDVMVDDDTVEARPFVWDGGLTLPRKYPSASRPQLQSYVAHDGSMTTLAASINAVTAVRVDIRVSNTQTQVSAFANWKRDIVQRT